MDLAAVKAKLSQLQNTESGKKKETSDKFKPSVGEQTIRVVPSKHSPDLPFTELKVHYNRGQRVMVSPLNWGDRDPLMEFAEKLREGDYEKERYKLSKSIEPKTRYFCQVVIRGEEDKGVKIWEFGKTVYEELLALALDEEVGDFTDVDSGRDLKLTTTSPEQNGTSYNKTTLRIKLTTSPLSTNPDQVEQFLENQDKPIDRYKIYSFDEMKTNLQNWLDPDSSKGGDSQPNQESKDVFPSKEDVKKRKEESIMDGPSTDFKDEDTTDVKKSSSQDEFKKLFEKTE
jgi:hypothetical protein